MNSTNAEIRMYIARSHRAQQIREAARERQFHAAIRNSSSNSFRRSIGRSIIRIGERMAAESAMSSARSAQG